MEIRIEITMNDKTVRNVRTTTEDTLQAVYDAIGTERNWAEIRAFQVGTEIHLTTHFQHKKGKI